MKKTLLVIVDALASRVVIPAMRQGRLPNLSALADRGVLKPESVAIFPSITPAATTSIITGHYPKDHCVLGYHWYDVEDDEVVYYGNDFWVIWREGFDQFFKDFLYKLNHERIRSDTLFQLIERSNLKTATLNYLIFRGDVKHKVDAPWWVRLIPGTSTSAEVCGPSIMYFGDLVDTEIDDVGDSLDRKGGLFHRFGFDDANTGKLLMEMAEDRVLPPFTIAYFPDNDYRSHEVGPEEAVTTLEEVDAQLGEFFEAFGGIDAMLEELCLIITGDHSQTDMVDDKEEAGIRLNEILSDFSIVKAGDHWEEDNELVLCPDMRSAQIYFRDPTPQLRDEVAYRLLRDPRVDQVLWRTDVFGEKEKRYCVNTRNRGSLEFQPGSDGPATAIDLYGCCWSWRGELGAVDGKVSEDDIITFGDYPNAFERIVGALDNKNSGHLWLTAQPGYEFALTETSVHVGGGSHGSLHALDSLSPLFIAGAPSRVELPKYPRTVDITPLCLSLLGIESEYKVDESRIATERCE